MSVVDGKGLAIVVVNYGASELLALNLAPLTAALPGVIAVVVDNRTDEAERTRVTDLAAKHGWSLDTPDSNLGFGGGANRGAAVALALGAAHLLVLNPDATISAAGALALLQRSQSAPANLYSPRVVRPDGSAWFAGADLDLDDGRLRRAGTAGAAGEPWLSGACLLASAELWRRVGGFDEDYFLYWEDVDLSHRALATGAALVLCDDVVAVHDEGGTHRGPRGRGRAKSDTYYFYMIRNRLLFAAKHLDDARFSAWKRNTRAVAFEVLLQGGRRQFVRRPGLFLLALRALRAGERLAASVRSPKNQAPQSF